MPPAPLPSAHSRLPPVFLSPRINHIACCTPQNRPGANPARYYELKTAAHTEPMSSQKQIDALWDRPSACQLLSPDLLLSFCVPNFAEQSQFQSRGPSIEFSMSCSTFVRALRPIRSGRPIAPSPGSCSATQFEQRAQLMNFEKRTQCALLQRGTPVGASPTSGGYRYA